MRILRAVDPQKWRILLILCPCLTMRPHRTRSSSLFQASRYYIDFIVGIIMIQFYHILIIIIIITIVVCIPCALNLCYTSCCVVMVIIFFS